MVQGLRGSGAGAQLRETTGARVAVVLRRACPQPPPPAPRSDSLLVRTVILICIPSAAHTHTAHHTALRAQAIRLCPFCFGRHRMHRQAYYSRCWVPCLRPTCTHVRAWRPLCCALGPPARPGHRRARPGHHPRVRAFDAAACRCINALRAMRLQLGVRLRMRLCACLSHSMVGSTTMSWVPSKVQTSSPRGPLLATVFLNLEPLESAAGPGALSVA